MCTLILLHRCVEGAPLVVAANRDESLSRPAARPDLLFAGRLPVVAPRDLRAGGTWLGVNATGLFAGLTNRPIRVPDTTRRSRGLLVLDALAESDAEAAAAVLASLPSGAYNPFNLVVADRARAFVCVYAETPRVTPLAPGVHVIGNADPDDRRVAKIDRLARQAESARDAGPDGVLDALAALCRGHDRPAGAGPLEDACIHTSVYGTRSSTLLRLGARAGSDTLKFADGAPCRSTYEDFTHLLGALGHETVARSGAHSSRVAS